MNCIIVDDRADSQVLGSLVAKCSWLNLVGTYDDSAAALNHLTIQRNIDLAFIDIKTAGLESLEHISNLNRPPFVIATSSDAQHAMKAFDHNCVDYLLKPVSYPRFFKAVNKTIRYNSLRELSSTKDTEIFIKKDFSLVKLSMKDIAYIEALENYIILNTVDKRFTLHFTMKGFENQLPPSYFIRVHRSFIVNKKLIKSINEDHLQLMLGKNIKTIPVGKSFRNSILEDIRVLNR